MINKMTKADFLLKIKSMESPSIFCGGNAVYVYDFLNPSNTIEIYVASRKDGYGHESVANQAGKFRKWILQARKKGA